MKHTFRKLLSLVLALATIGALLTPAFAAKTDTLTLDSYPGEGPVSVNTYTGTPFFVTPTVTSAKGENVTDYYNFTYRWMLNNECVSVSNYYEFPAKMKPISYTLTCAVTATHKTDRTVKSAQLTWYPAVEHEQDIDLTVSQNIGNYYFDDSTTQTGASVYSEIRNALGLSSTADLSEYQVSFIPNSSQIILFNGPSVCRLDELNKVYLSISGIGTWITHYTVLYKNAIILSGILTINIEPYVALDNIYSAAPGEEAVIPADDIIAFWMNATSSYSTLQNVFITGCSGMSGVLCYDHSSTEKTHSIAFNTVMYASPVSSAQKPLADLTFIPTKVGNSYPSGSVTITIAAVGLDAKNTPITVNGTFMIFYASKEPDTITYECTGSHVMLNSNDFDAVYRAVTGTNVTSPSYSIRFLDLPSYGTLYRDYKADDYGTINSTPITSSNISLTTFSSLSTSQNSLDNVAYFPSGHASGGDTIRYVAYSGNRILYVGTINFTSREFVVTYTTSSTVKFSSLDFYASGSPLLNAQFIVFGTPSSGTLYKDYENSVRVQTYDYFSFSTNYGVNLLDNVTYVPRDGFVGTVEIPFAGHALTGGLVSGKIRIYVVRDFFSDVDPNNWAAPYINRLYATGVINGTSATTFSPNADMTYGAALKMILLAAGYPKQSETGGTHWASNYLTLAYRNGIVSTTDIDLNAAVDRNTIAEIAAKALGLAKASSVNAGIVPPTDSTNGYVYALYNAGILNGNFVGGYNYFYGSNRITRAEVAKIICMINDYNK